MKKKRRICIHPDCDRRLSASNIYGLCVEHSHMTRYCPCPQCADHSSRRRLIEDERKRLHVVPHTTTGREFAASQISLPREPWW